MSLTSVTISGLIVKDLQVENASGASQLSWLLAHMNAHKSHRIMSLTSMTNSGLIMKDLQVEMHLGPTS